MSSSRFFLFLSTFCEALVFDSTCTRSLFIRLGKIGQDLIICMTPLYPLMWVPSITSCLSSYQKLWLFTLSLSSRKQLERQEQSWQYDGEGAVQKGMWPIWKLICRKFCHFSELGRRFRHISSSHPKIPCTLIHTLRTSLDRKIICMQNSTQVSCEEKCVNFQLVDFPTSFPQDPQDRGEVLLMKTYKTPPFVSWSPEMKTCLDLFRTSLNWIYVDILLALYASQCPCRIYLRGVGLVRSCPSESNMYMLAERGKRLIWISLPHWNIYFVCKLISLDLIGCRRGGGEVWKKVAIWLFTAFYGQMLILQEMR